MVRTMKMSFYKRKINKLRSVALCLLHRKLQVPYLKLSAHLAQTSTNSQRLTDCVLIEGKPSTDIVVLDRYHLMIPQS